MAEQKKKSTSTKSKSTSKAKTKAKSSKSKSEAKTKAKGLPAVLKTAAKGWRKVESKRIAMLEDSVSRYFDARHSLLDAKSIRERAKIRADFTREAFVREVENFRELNKLRVKAGKDTFETLRDVVPTDPKEAVDTLRDTFSKAAKKAA